MIDNNNNNNNIRLLKLVNQKNLSVRGDKLFNQIAKPKGFDINPLADTILNYIYILSNSVF